MSSIPPPLPKKGSFLGLFIALGFGALAMLAVAGFGVFKSGEMFKQRREARRELDAFQEHNQARLRASIEGKESLAQSSERMQAAQQELGEIAKKMPGTDKEILISGQEIVGEMQPALKKYQAARAELMSQKAFDASGLHSREDIQKRREVVRAFSEANREFTEAFALSPEHFRMRMKARGISAAKCESEVKRFIAGSHGDLVAIVREDDRKLGVIMLEMLALLDERWGKWKGSEGGRLTFQEDADREHYNKLVEALQAAAKHQAEAQQKML